MNVGQVGNLRPIVNRPARECIHVSEHFRIPAFSYGSAALWGSLSRLPSGFDPALAGQKTSRQQDCAPYVNWQSSLGLLF
jgi:hypothetical protein